MAQLSITVSSKGQMVLPASVRKELGIVAGSKLDVFVGGGQIILNPQSLEAKLQRIKSLRGITAGGPSMCDELLEERRRDLERETREGW